MYNDCAVNHFLNTMRKTIARHAMFSPGEAVVAGVSGGADSVALLRGLLLLADELSITVLAAHINHNLRGDDAKADEQYTAEICARWAVPLRVFQADVRGLANAEGARLSLEEAGRRLRYECLRTARSAFGAAKIAVAHNQNDNAETVLINLCRGAGLKGLCGIPPVNAAVVRPLIETPRAVIEAFLAEQNIAYRTDESNYDAAYTRNRVRHGVMPVIKSELGEKAAEVISRNSLLLREDEAFLAKAATEAFSDCLCETETAPAVVALDIAKLCALPGALKRRVVREALHRISGAVTDIGAAHTEQILSLLDGETGKEARIANGLRVSRVYERLEFSCREQALPQKAFCVPLVLDQPVYVAEINKTVLVSSSETDVKDGYTKQFRYDKIQSFLTLRTRRPGDRIHLAGLGGRKIQDYFTDRKIPRDIRDTIPLLADGGEIVWIMDGTNRVNSRYAPEPGCRSVWVSIY